jgi:hypothetical protein
VTGEEDEDALVLPITGELDLHTFTPREAVSVVEDYLDECRRRGVLEVRIVHGRGQGVRRAEVWRSGATSWTSAMPRLPPADGEPLSSCWPRSQSSERAHRRPHARKNLGLRAPAPVAVEIA